MGHVPVVDGPGGVIPDRPLQMRSDGDFNKVPEMIGLTVNDGYTFITSREYSVWNYNIKGQRVTATCGKSPQMKTHLKNKTKMYVYMLSIIMWW